jgi:hypothetical protein
MLAPSSILIQEHSAGFPPQDEKADYEGKVLDALLTAATTIEASAFPHGDAIQHVVVTLSDTIRTITDGISAAAIILRALDTLSKTPSPRDEGFPGLPRYRWPGRMMTALTALLSEFAERPSIIWRLAWLVFFPVVMCLFGAPALRRIIPHVLTGISGAQAGPVPTIGEADQSKDNSRLATWILPLISWAIPTGVLISMFAHR